MREQGLVSWQILKDGLHARFGLTRFEDFFAVLTKLKQIGTIKDYQSHFERLLTRVGKLTPAQQVGCFISGLGDNLRADVKALKPTALSADMGLVCLYEARNLSQRIIASPDARRVNPPPASLSSAPHHPNHQVAYSHEMEE